MKIIPESKYQPEVDALMEKLKAGAVVLIVLEGSRGDGAASNIRKDLIPKVVLFLEGMAEAHLSGEAWNMVSRMRVK